MIQISNVQFPPEGWSKSQKKKKDFTQKNKTSGLS